jgi:Na+-driven multidrug efflux pump
MVWEILRLSIPSIITMILELLVEVINTVYVGHLGNTAMVAGVGLGNMYINILCASIYFGLNSALATLVS